MRRLLPVLVSFAISVVWLPPLTARAEGARMELNCVVAESCGTTGSCAPGAAQHRRLTLAPQETGDDGAGRYGVVMGEGVAEAEALSGTGPFVWTDLDGTVLTLILSTQDAALLHRQWLSGPPRARTEFLNCEISG